MILGVLLDDAIVAQLESVFGCEFRRTADVGEAVAAVRCGRASAVIVSVWDGSGASLAPIVQRIRDSRVTVPIVVYSDQRPESLREVLKFGAAGATVVAVSGVDERPEVWRKLVVRSNLPSITDVVLGSLRGYLDVRLEPAARFCLENATRPLKARDVCAAIGVTRRTLSGWVSAGGLAGVRGLITACKTAAGIWLVVGLEDTVESAALSLGFSNGSHLLNTVKGRVGATFSTIRAEPDLPRWWRRTFGLTE